MSSLHDLRRQHVTARVAGALGERLGPAATFATTEHFNLQTARSITVSESNGRASVVVGACAGVLLETVGVGSPAIELTERPR